MAVLTGGGTPDPRKSRLFRHPAAAALIPGDDCHDVQDMQFNPTMRLTRFLGTRDGRRIPGRLAQEQLVSSLGPVLDLSAGGMRVLSTRPVLGIKDVGLRGGEFSVKLTTKVAWSRRLGFRRHEIGLAFLDVDEELATMLSRISRDHRARSAI